MRCFFWTSRTFSLDKGTFLGTLDLWSEAPDAILFFVIFVSVPIFHFPISFFLKTSETPSKASEVSEGLTEASEGPWKGPKIEY